MDFTDGSHCVYQSEEYYDLLYIKMTVFVNVFFFGTKLPQHAKLLPSAYTNSKDSE